MREGGTVQIIDAEHAHGKFRRSEHPSATEAAQTVSFGEAVGNDEALRIDMERTGGRRFKKHLAVDFVHQNARADFGSNLSYFPQRIVGDQSAGGVVQVANHNQPGARSQVALYVVRINGKIILSAAGEALD